jgi:hypothetical protein
MDTARHIGIAPNTFRENACRYCLSIFPVRTHLYRLLLLLLSKAYPQLPGSQGKPESRVILESRPECRLIRNQQAHKLVFAEQHR